MEKVNVYVVTIHAEAIADPKKEVKELKQSKYPNSLNFEEGERTPGKENTELVAEVE